MRRTRAARCGTCACKVRPAPGLAGRPLSASRPDLALAPPRVIAKASATGIEDHHCPAGTVSRPPGIASRGEPDPGRVHLLRHVMRCVAPRDELGSLGRQIVEYERDIEPMSGAHLRMPPGELIEMGSRRPAGPRLGYGEGT